MPLPTRENLLVEFKAVPRAGLADKVVLDAVVGFANASGGTLYIGVEDSGKVTGIPKDSKWLDPHKIRAFVLERTVPSVRVDAEIVETDGGLSVAVVHVPVSDVMVASNDGRVVRRRIKADGGPENMLVYPIDYSRALQAVRYQDLTRATVPQTTLEDLDDRERSLLRKVIQNARGDDALLALDDDEFDRALGLVDQDEDGAWRPTLAGLLVIGRKAAIARCVPTHGVLFQQTPSGTLAS